MHFFAKNRRSHLQSNKNKRLPLRRKHTTKLVNVETTTAANDNGRIVDSFKDRLRPNRAAIVNASCGSEIESDNDTSSLFSVGSNLRSDIESGSDSESVLTSSEEGKTRIPKKRNHRQNKAEFLLKWRTGSLLAKEERKQIKNLAPALLPCR